MVRPLYPAFGFPSAPLMTPPSIAVRALHRMRTLATVVCGMLIASMIINLVLGIIVVRQADADPYATDGSMSGCQVTILPSV